MKLGLLLNLNVNFIRKTMSSDRPKARPWLILEKDDDDDDGFIKLSGNIPEEEEKKDIVAPPAASARTVPLAIEPADRDYIRTALADQTYDLSRGIDLFLGSGLMSNSMADFMTPGNKKAEMAKRTAANIAQDFIAVVRTLMEVPDTHTFIREMMKVEKLLSLLYFEKPKQQYVKGSILYILNKKKLPEKPQGVYAKVSTTNEGFLGVDKDAIMQNEINETLDKTSKFASARNAGDIEQEHDEERIDNENALSPEEAVEILTARTKRVAEIKEFTRQTINGWIYRNMQTRVFLKHVVGSMGVDQVNTYAMTDLTQNFMICWNRRMEHDLNKKPLAQMDRLGLYSNKDVDDFIQIMRNKPTLMESTILDHLRRDKEEPLRLIDEVFSPRLLSAVMLAWDLVENMLLDLKKKNPSARGFYIYSHLQSSRDVPDMRLFVVIKEEDAKAQAEFGKLVGILIRNVREAGTRTHHQITESKTDLLEALNLLCAQLRVMGFNGIVPNIRI